MDKIYIVMSILVDYEMYYSKVRCIAKFSTLAEAEKFVNDREYFPDNPDWEIFEIDLNDIK